MVLLCSLLFALCSTSALALMSDKDAPIHIDAKHVDLNEKTQIAVYRGNVVLTQGTFRLEAERLEVRARNYKARVVNAWGAPVRLKVRPDDRDEDAHAAAMRLTYNVDQREVELSGEALLRQGEDEFRAAVIHYDLDEQLLTAVGGSGAETEERVHAVIYPKADAPGEPNAP
ncbi:MAG: lipopolysaccharide transport periplasmic protein LptA [Candidatus Muproteobacteria bacterium RBG_16_65_34]|uniref:Lipopolysaccharide export system protein LptA n=1 Tax=Candidatus Muproteobacteria bacterium RBG_16_65_34 TaxID=1817760 RepID=A0A1F6TV71_9PROT|nr:MAG: lipopolysaccharide transport periplasmic protein LptA [Candidatus Muproteobacteria bacterium RBG_16_65_34]